MEAYLEGNRLGREQQLNLFQKPLIEQVNPKHPLILLSKKIPWKDLENKLAPYYSKNGRPAKPIRLMVGLLILKQMYNSSDERIVAEWIENIYFQSFCGMMSFQWKAPCNPSDITYFRNRIGEKGVAEIFKVSIEIHEEKKVDNSKKEKNKIVLDKEGEEVILDTTVQEKNITFPTDNKLYRKTIAWCLCVAKKEQIILRRSYKRELRRIYRTLRFKKTKGNSKVYSKACKRLKTIAKVLLREIQRKFTLELNEKYKEKIELCTKVLEQKKESKNKAYSLHEPKVACIAKGKTGKKYEFGSKVSIAIGKKSGLILGVANFTGSPYDGDTIENTLQNIKFNIGKVPSLVYADRGYRGRPVVGETKILIPTSSTKNSTKLERKKARKNFGRRSAIEPIIGHLKSDFRLCRNYLKGVVGDAINLYMAAAASNFRKWMRGLPSYLIFVFNCLFSALARLQEGFLPSAKPALAPVHKF